MEDKMIGNLIPLLGQFELIAGHEALAAAGLTTTVLGADGSSRCFVRIEKAGKPLCLAVFPASLEIRDLAEARSAWHIGRHLQQQGIPVPRLYGWNDESGAILFEDLGDTRLYEAVRETDFADLFLRQRLVGLYEETIERLIAMQIDGARGFAEGWCWDTPCYDRQLMLERESGYFLRAFWQDLLGRRLPERIEMDFRAIADQAAEAPAGFFLHRDFQSRNIMIKDERIRFIDFQGGRRGPLAYDLASLLTDPYAALPGAIQEHLLHFYLEQLGRRMTIDAKAFRRHYSLLALQRNLQIVGAFAFLSQVRGKDFFAGYIRPAVAMLHTRLQDPIFRKQTVLRRTVDLAVEALNC